MGNDETARILKKAAEDDGLKTLYLVDPLIPTGKCAVLVTGSNRSMVTDLLAANAFKIEHLEKPEVWLTVNNTGKASLPQKITTSAASS